MLYMTAVYVASFGFLDETNSCSSFSASCHSKDELCCCPCCWAVITFQALSIKALDHGEGDERGQRGLLLTLYSQTATCSKNCFLGDKVTVRTKNTDHSGYVDTFPLLPSVFLAEPPAGRSTSLNVFYRLD